MFKFILPTILLFFSISLYVSYIGPGFDEIGDLNKDIEMASSTLAIQKERIETELAELKSHIDSIDIKDKEKLDRLVPRQDDFNEAGFINDMNNIAIKHSLVIDGVSFSNQSSLIGNTDSTGDTDNTAGNRTGDYGTFKMNFGVESTYKEFILFMKDIERNEQLIDVDVTSFSTADTGVYNYSVSLSTYWLK